MRVFGSHFIRGIVRLAPKRKDACLKVIGGGRGNWTLVDVLCRHARSCSAIPPRARFCPVAKYALGGARGSSLSTLMDYVGAWLAS